jgi:DMSO/TMAO reductase YedYZ molybdopterin-dependent catalytic subunit
MRPTSPPVVSQVTVERRSVLRWLGNATVLALGSDLLSACVGKSRSDRLDAGSTIPDGGLAGSGVDASSFVFAPGADTDPMFESWFENTVDAQDVVQILASWELTVDGMASHPLTLSFADVIALDRQDQVTDFHCVEGWSVYDVPWNGVSLAHVLDLAGVDASATHLTFHGVGGQYSESLPISVAREAHTLLGYGVGGQTLPLGHGFPVRLVVPRLLGYKNAKYLARIEATDHPVTGFWEGYGYSYEGEVPSSRLRPGKY